MGPENGSLSSGRCVDDRRRVDSQEWHTIVMDSVVVRDPAIMSGEPTFRGTRVLVRTLFDYLEAGHSLERFLEGFPTVSRKVALQALEEAKESLLASR
jgi:uncharacterized protein (DUF433 family)